ncbi:hypothetical protein, partial [Teichococcus aestuarii]
IPVWLAGWAAALGAAVLAVLGLLGAGRRQGRAEAETAATRRDIQAREIRDAVERDVAREPDPAQRLRERWTRD